MAIGDTVVSNGVVYEVVWSGEMELIGDRATKHLGPWEPPKRLYNKTGKYAKKNKEVENEIVNPLEDEE